VEGDLLCSGLEPEIASSSLFFLALADAKSISDTAATGIYQTKI
jgi:hypothetical protein